jgi:hypothetical protein
VTVTITGLNYAPGSPPGTPPHTTVSFSGNPSDITVGAITFSGTTTMTFQITVSASATTGPRDVTVTNPDGQFATLTGGFTINLPLTITGSLPSWTLNKVGYPANPLTASGGSGTGYQWSWTSAPPGLTLSSNGTITGTPNVAGTYTTTVSLKDSIGDSTSSSFTVKIAAAPMIVSVQLRNGGSTTGKIEKGDQIVITFSEQLNDSTLCTGWSGTGSQSSTGTLTVNDGTGSTHDSISISGVACGTFNFGSLDLGSNAYVSGGNATFGGGGNNATTIAWDGASTLTITLGKGAGGTVGIVSSSTPVYSASGSVKDPTGATIGNTPFTLPTGMQF